jgi:hypothetical protein
MLLLVLVIKLMAEIALMALLGQWLLGLMIGARREHNLFYRLLQTVARPPTALAQRLQPRSWPAERAPALAALLVGVVWLAATAAKLRLCLLLGAAACR